MDLGKKQRWVELEIHLPVLHRHMVILCYIVSNSVVLDTATRGEKKKIKLN